MSGAHSADNIVEVRLRAIEQWLTRHGYSVKRNVMITGKAGIAHEIGFYAENPSEGRLIFAKRPPGVPTCEEDVIRLFAICLDVDATGIIITARVNMMKNAAKLANLYRIGVIDADSQGKQVNLIQDRLVQNKQFKGLQ
jgi:hypothetical protein